MGLALFLAGATPPSAACHPIPGDEPQEAIDRLLESYGRFKGYQDTNPRAVESTLDASRAAVFHSIVRALHQPVLLTRGAPQRPVDLVETVTGIWGVRPGNPEGRHQFRMSVIWRGSIREALAAATNFDPAPAHILLPGGDDERAFEGFKLIGGRSYKLAGHEPKLQLSFEKDEGADHPRGEIDIDYDGGCCHLAPANSDPGSRKRDTPHDHLEAFNARFGFFQPPLELNWHDHKRHCSGHY